MSNIEKDDNAIGKRTIIGGIVWIIIWLFIYFVFFDASVEAPSINNDDSNIENVNDLNDLEYVVEKVLDISCEKDDDCETPVEYLIMSSCPFTSKCIEKKCNVICPNF